MNDNLYLEVKQFRETHIGTVCRNHFLLNQFHEVLLEQVLKISINKITDQYGPPPSPFSFFVMGSAGRFEQSIWSDQDHGIVYQNPSDDAKNYFLALGKEISTGLHHTGYAYCDGRVMADNPLWCKSFSEWQLQLIDWTRESSWESIRHLLIFIDGRSVYGEQAFIEKLKTFVYQTVQKEHLLSRILNNTIHHKKGLGVFGQILPETHGGHAGALNLKEIALFPYVNAARLLAIKGGVQETSTLLRLDKLQIEEKELYKTQFLKLLEYRLIFGNHANYDSGHYLKIDHLTKEQKKIIKDIIKNGSSLYQYTRRLVEKED